MHKGAPPENFARARILRENMTPAEKIIWERIKANQLGVNFRRQHPIHIYIADFYCHEYNLIVELDGEYHSTVEQEKKDKERSEILEFQDREILRFNNREVVEEIESVLQKIREKIQSITPHQRDETKI